MSVWIPLKFTFWQIKPIVLCYIIYAGLFLFSGHVYSHKIHLLKPKPEWWMILHFLFVYVMLQYRTSKEGEIFCHNIFVDMILATQSSDSKLKDKYKFTMEVELKSIKLCSSSTHVWLYIEQGFLTRSLKGTFFAACEVKHFHQG